MTEPRRLPAIPVLLLLFLLLLVGILVALMSGPMLITLNAVWVGWQGGDDTAWRLVRDLRMPRVLMGSLVGASLASAGAVLQGLFRNPLADPGLIGISAGASLGAVAVIVLGGSLSRALSMPLPEMALPAFSFLGALLTASLIWLLARRGGVTQVALLLLAGIAIGAIAMALTGLLTFFADDNQLRTLTFWSMGSLAHSRWQEVAMVAPWLLASLIAMPLLSRGLNALMLGEEAATHMGAAVAWTKRGGIISAAVAVGAAVAAAGMISFIGLVAPHLVRLLIGVDHRYLIPGSALMGATLMVLADVLARTMVVPAELPIGLVMALLGGPFFLVLLLRQRVV